MLEDQASASEKIADALKPASQLYGVTDALVAYINELLDKHSAQPDSDELASLSDEVRPILKDLHGADFADLLELLGTAQRLQLFAAVASWINPETVSYLDVHVSESLFAELHESIIARFLHHLESDDALDLIARLDEDRQQRLLKAVPARDRILYEQSLNFPENSAGRLMRREAVTVPSFWTVGQAIDHMRNPASQLPVHFYNLIVIGPSHRPIASVPTSVLLRSPRNMPLAHIMDDAMMKPVPAMMESREIASLFLQYGLVEVPVIDPSERLIGTITIDDIVEVMDKAHEENLLKLGGLQGDDFFHTIFRTARLRLSWLGVNLLTAILASVVIALFEDLVDRVVALAILMPIVASMGGNAATQTMTVAVRALAVNELTASNALRMIGKELIVGSLNGVLFALAAAGCAWIWFGDMQIGLVIAIAMLVSLVIAAMAGILIPLGLHQFKIDPAIASTVLVTTITDVTGFLAFLGIASLILL